MRSVLVAKHLRTTGDYEAAKLLATFAIGSGAAGVGLLVVAQSRHHILSRFCDVRF